MLDPQRHHRKYHDVPPVPFEDCWRCGRDRAVCLSKIRFGSWQEANEWVTEYNVSRGWAPPHMTRYRCRWCQGWHMKTAKDPRARARMEKQRRKWLTARATELRDPDTSL